MSDSRSKHNAIAKDRNMMVERIERRQKGDKLQPAAESATKEGKNRLCKYHGFAAGRRTNRCTNVSGLLRQIELNREDHPGASRRWAPVAARQSTTKSGNRDGSAGET